MLSQEENDLFTKFGPGMPMGELLRRYWNPVGLSELVTRKPQRITILGEELNLYRGESGKSGAGSGPIYAKTRPLSSWVR